MLCLVALLCILLQRLLVCLGLLLPSLSTCLHTSLSLHHLHRLPLLHGSPNRFLCLFLCSLMGHLLLCKFLGCLLHGLPLHLLHGSPSGCLSLCSLLCLSPSQSLLELLQFL